MNLDMMLKASTDTQFYLPGTAHVFEKNRPPQHQTAITFQKKIS